MTVYSFKRPEFNVNLMNNYISYAGIDFHNDFVVENVTTSLFPSSEVSVVTYPRNIGSKFIRIRENIRKVLVDIRFVESEDTIYSKVLEVSSKIKSIKVPSRLYIKNTDFYYIAILTSESILEREYGTLKTQLEFTCYDPYIYKETSEMVVVNSETTSPDLSLTHEIYVTDYPSMSFNVISDIESISKIYIKRNSGGHQLVLNGPFYAGDLVGIDQNLWTVSVNGSVVPNKIDINESTLVPLIPNKINTIRFTGGGASVGALTLTWITKYL